MQKLMAELCDCLRGLKYEELKDKKVVLDCLRSKNKDLLFELVKSLDHDEYNMLVNIKLAYNAYENALKSFHGCSRR